MTQAAVFVVFIDYDNLLQTHKSAGILNIVTKALIQIPLDRNVTRLKCDIRIYGGWYEGTQITRLAQNVSIEIQREFPTIIRLPSVGGRNINVNATAELAVSLMKEPGFHLFNTLRRKEKVGNIQIECPTDIGCADSECILPSVKKLLSKGKCPKIGCGVAAGKLVYRQEQKIVDTMLACDLIHAATGPAQKVILVSSDDDFLPPLRTVILDGTEAVRFHPKQNNQRGTISQHGTRLLEMDL